MGWAAIAALLPQAEAEWSVGPERWVHLLGTIGAWTLLLLLAIVVVRGVVRRHHYRAVAVLDEAARERVHAAIREAETATVGEVLPVVLERSDPHPSADWKAALVVMLLGSALLAERLPWDEPALLLACQIGMGAAGFLLARASPDFKRLFVFETRAGAVAEEQAEIEFARQRLHETGAGTGVLLFVSLFERRVVVLADRAIAGKVDPDTWEEIDALVIDAVAEGRLADGLCAAVRRCGALLAEHFPWTEGTRNEIPDRLEVRRE